jgi:aspartate kinase
MSIIVQKYGGSSLADADAIRNVAGRIACARNKGHQVVAVVSAMGDTTDDLIAMAHRVSERPDPRELDVLLSTGELVSCTLVAMALRYQKHDAVSLSGAQAGIRTDTGHGRARISVVEPGRIRDELANGRIVIVAGFQGITDRLDITTLGRGASDLSAVAIAARLGADRCEVYTDVDGIYTADPALVPEARKMDEVGFEEMLELASHGAKMNPRSIELAMVYNVPVLVANSFGERPGTLIHKGAEMGPTVGEIRNRVRAIATDANVAKLTVLGVKDRPGIAASLFEPLAGAGISVDVIVQNSSVDGATDLTFTVGGADLARAMEVVEQLARDLGSRGVVSAENLAKVSIVGTGMLDAPGYAARMFRALADANINIDMITTSEIRITCIVGEEHVEDATRILHAAFQLDRPEPVS